MEWGAIVNDIKSNLAKSNSTSTANTYTYRNENHNYIHVSKNTRQDVYYHRPKQRNVVRREFIQFAPITIRYNSILKWCILLIIIMCVFCANIGLFPEISSQEFNKIESTTEIQYDENYKFIDNGNVIIDRLINCGHAISNFGASDSWLKIYNNATNSSFDMLTTVFFLPINFIINIGILFSNLYNAITGNARMIKPTYNSPSETIKDVIGRINIITWW